MEQVLPAVNIPHFLLSGVVCLSDGLNILGVCLNTNDLTI